MTKNEIISTLFTGKNFRDCIAKMEPVHLQEDLKGEVALVVCEWSEEKVISLHQAGKLEFYVVRVILNMLTNKYSPFYKKFRQVSEPMHESGESFEGDRDKMHQSNIVEQVNQAVQSLVDEDIEFRKEREAIEDYTIEEINRLHWYDAELLRIYLRVGNFRAIEAETKIPYVSCYNSIKKSMATLKKKAEAARPLFDKKELSFIQNNSV